jgi:hypothetical protein
LLANQKNSLLDLLGLNQLRFVVHRTVGQSVAVRAFQSSIVAERGFTVLDQPQHLARLSVPVVPPYATRIAKPLRLGVATAALRLPPISVDQRLSRPMDAAHQSSAG